MLVTHPSKPTTSYESNMTAKSCYLSYFDHSSSGNFSILSVWRGIISRFSAGQTYLILVIGESTVCQYSTSDEDRYADESSLVLWWPTL